jgi:CubicO group peptidase (beta-lactamase class C family)
MIELNTVRDRLQAVIREQMDAGNIPGLALALTDRTRTLWVAADGYADLAARIPLNIGFGPFTTQVVRPPRWTG